MPSSKGKPTDPKLYEEVKEDIKAQPTSKDGSGKGGWAAWKGAKQAKEYEAKGGEYENSPGSKNEPKKGTPGPKGDAKKDKEVKETEQNGETEASEAPAKETKKVSKKGAAAEKTEEKKAGGRGRPPKSGGGGGAAKMKKEPTPGTRKSERVSKREADNKDDALATKKQKK